MHGFDREWITISRIVPRIVYMQVNVLISAVPGQVPTYKKHEDNEFSQITLCTDERCLIFARWIYVKLNVGFLSPVWSQKAEEVGR